MKRRMASCSLRCSGINLKNSGCKLPKIRPVIIAETYISFSVDHKGNAVVSAAEVNIIKNSGKLPVYRLVSWPLFIVYVIVV